ncbi:hypothetical protein G6O67_007851 [Ophiocordyceps sinensis]|nr:hypothetical protein G6O67_007851 [Ophiocordyceps sinensis]
MYRRLSAHLLMTNTVSLLLLLWIVFLYRQSLEQPYRYERPKVELRGLAEIPVEREMRQFHTGIQPGDTTPFMGGLTDEANAAWASILDAGLVKLTPEQAAKLPYETARDPHDSSSYVGVLDVFHQLHCLNHIREGYYNAGRRELAPQPGEIVTHVDHCFDFLRQNLMCWSDTSITPIGWSSDRGEFVPQYDPIKECANFDKIHVWAKGDERWLPDEPGHRNQST